MGKCTILLTNYYPYYKGEEYLETEIEFLAAKFEKVIIIPTMVNSEMKQTRQVPGTVEVINIDYRHTKTNKVKNTIKRSNGVKSISNKLSHRLYQNYFNNRSLEVVELIVGKIDKIDFSEYEDIIIYSYWLYITAQVAVMMNEMVFEGKAKTCSRAHGYDINEMESKLKFLPSREYLLKKLNRVYPCSDFGTEFLQTKYPDYYEKIYTKRLGTEFKGDNKLEIEQKFLIVSCSTIRPLKRLDIIIDALEELEKNNIEYHWSHFGDGEDFEKIKRIAEQKLNTNNYSLKGSVKNYEVLDYYLNHRVDCFVNVSTSEGVPVSVMEAMSFSIPIIATDVGGTKEIVYNNKNGYLLEKNINGADLATSLIKMLNSQNMKIKFRENSKQIWTDKCNRDKNYKEFMNELYSL